MNVEESNSLHGTDNPETSDNPENDNKPTEKLEPTSVVEEPNQENKESNNCEKCKKFLKNFAYLNVDFENYRKNIVKERGLLVERIEAKTISSFLSIIDDFERALKEIEVSVDNKKSSHVEGFKIIYQSFLNILNSHGVKEI